MPVASSVIVGDALAMAKRPGFLSYGGRALNMTLEDLWMHRNLKVNLVRSTITTTPYSNGPFNLETDYARTYDMWYMVTGTPYFLNPCTLRDFDQDQQSGLSSYPSEWATDLSGVPTVGYGSLYVYPQSNMALTLFHRYFVRRPDISTPETSSVVPWFEDQDYLTVATAMRVMRITGDDRYASFAMECDKLLLKHLLTEGDEQQAVRYVKLDPRMFKVKSSNRPTKSDPW